MPELDELDQPAAEGASNTPTPQTPDLEAIVRAAVEKSLGAELNTRISGLQSVMDRRLAAMAKEFKNAGLSQDEQEDLMAQEQSKETAKALQLAELIKRRKTAPEAVDFFIEMMEANDLDEQIAFIQNRVAPKPATGATKEPATPSSGEAPNDAPVPDVDKNNPASHRSPALESGEDMNEELADTILDSIGPGGFRGLFRRG